MAGLKDGESVEVKGSAAKPYIIKNTSGVISCSCPAWRNQSTPINARACKHTIKVMGKESEEKRIKREIEAPAPKIEKVAAPPLLLAEIWTEDVDPTGWLMSEKLDGCRAMWDGKNFISRLGNTYHAPEWFKKGLPEFPLDGELFLRRKAFQETVSIIRRDDAGDLWKDIRYMVFEAHTSKGNFEERYLKAASALKHWSSFRSRTPPYAGMVVQTLCKSLEHMKDYLKQLQAKGAEGIMLRVSTSDYIPGRNRTLLKVKDFKDAEAVVVSYEGGKGKHKGRMGKMLVRMDNGKEFYVGTGFSDAERDDPPEIGVRITFKYFELSNDGIPRFASFIGERIDG